MSALETAMKHFCAQVRMVSFCVERLRASEIVMCLHPRLLWDSALYSCLCWTLWPKG